MKSALNQRHEHAAKCPFCGSGGEFLRYKARAGILFDSMGVFEGDYKNVERIMCIFCGADGPSAPDADNAVTKWNRRT